MRFKVLIQRLRVWIFFFVLLATIFVATQVALGVHGGLWQFAITTFVLMPCTCLMKSMIMRVYGFGEPE